MKTICVRVVTNARVEQVVAEGEILKVKVGAKAQDGKANKAVIDALAKYYSKRRGDIRIVRGERSRDKLVQIS